VSADILTASTVRLVQRSDDPLAAALLEIAELHERCARLQQDNQRLIHERDRLQAQLGDEVRAARSDGSWGLVVHCDNTACSTPPLRIRVAPPEDAVPAWVRGMGWTVDAEKHWCPTCASVTVGQVRNAR
jgi:hypothetical protein